MRVRPQWGVLIYHSGLDDSSSTMYISHREGRPKHRRFGHPAHGFRSSGGLRLWTACSGPPTTSRPAAALRVPHHIRLIAVPSTRNDMARPHPARPTDPVSIPSRHLPRMLLLYTPCPPPHSIPRGHDAAVSAQGTARYPRESQRSLASDPTCLTPAWRSLGRRMLRGSDGGERGRRRQARAPATTLCT